MDKQKKPKKPQEPREDEGIGPICAKENADQIEMLVEENLRLTKEIFKMTKKINNFVLWSRILGFLKVLLIIAPIVFGIIYFKPILGLFNNAFAPYKELLNIGGESGGLSGSQFENKVNSGGIDINRISPELKKLIGK